MLPCSLGSAIKKNIKGLSLPLVKAKELIKSKARTKTSPLLIWLAKAKRVKQVQKVKKAKTKRVSKAKKGQKGDQVAPILQDGKVPAKRDSK